MKTRIILILSLALGLFVVQCGNDDDTGTGDTDTDTDTDTNVDFDTDTGTSNDGLCQPEECDSYDGTKCWCDEACEYNKDCCENVCAEDACPYLTFCPHPDGGVDGGVDGGTDSGL